MKKMNVEGIMSNDFVEVPLNTQVSTVAKYMSEKNASCAIVVEREQPIGIATRKDLVSVLARGLNPEDTVIKAVCSSPLKTLSYAASIQDGVKLMVETGLGHIVVEKNHKPIGILGEHQIMHSCGIFPGLPGDFQTIPSGLPGDIPPRLPGDIPPRLPGDIQTLPTVRKSPSRTHEFLSFYEPMKFCPNCGKPKEEDARCTHCGTFIFRCFSIDSDSELGEKFMEGSIPAELRDLLEHNGLSLPINPTVKKVKDKKWVITEREKISIYVVQG
jgi:CBS domain-containing protein/ribosomal protein L32